MADEPAATSVTRQVAEIVGAAEKAAADILRETEERANARIAEATRAADNRVAAAEAEAAEILGDAQRKAATLHETATTEAARLREEAERQAHAIRDEARREAEEVQRIAEVFATQTREGAQEEASRHVRRARDLAAEVLGEGTEMSHNLRQLSDSLRRNAQTLLTDVTAAHRALTARLDAAGLDEPLGAPDPPRGERPARRTSLPRVDEDIADVPEFIPATPRRRD